MQIRRIASVAPMVTTVALLAGCATPSGAPHPNDPLEGFNRSVYQFNDAVDRGLARPIAEFYTFMTPAPARNCIHNIFANLGDIWSAANSLLQGRGHDFANTIGRVLFNSTMGLGGCFDVHTANGGTRIRNDFGTTLGVWGVGHGPYLVLPLLGSSTIRDSVGSATDLLGNPAAIGGIDNVPLRNGLFGVQAVDTRASLLDASRMLDRTALDPYSFMRDAYLQRRNAMVQRRTPTRCRIMATTKTTLRLLRPHRSEHNEVFHVVTYVVVLSHRVFIVGTVDASLRSARPQGRTRPVRLGCRRSGLGRTEEGCLGARGRLGAHQPAYRSVFAAVCGF